MKRLLEMQMARSEDTKNTDPNLKHLHEFGFKLSPVVF